MFKFPSKILLLLFTIIFISCENDNQKIPQSSSTAIKDDLGNVVEFDSIPRRVISLAPSLTEAVFAVQADSFLIGNTLYCNFPNGAKKIDKVGDIITVDFEKIISLKPDLVLITAEGNSKDTYEKLLDLDLKVFVSNPRSFEGIKKTTSDLGKIFNKNEIADSLIKKWDSKFRLQRSKIDSSKNTSAMFLVSLSPIMLAGKNTFINELISTAGLENIASNTDMNYPVFSREEILKLNPDYIILEERYLEDSKKLSKIYPEWKNLKAVENGNIILINSSLYLVPGPRFVYALEDLINKIEVLRNS